METILTCGDDGFGPQTKCRGGLDFTLFFEDCFFSIVPSCLLILSLLLRGKSLWNSRTQKVGRSPLYWAKLILAQAFGACQLSLLIVWALPHAPRTRASLAATALTLSASLGLLFLSHFEHLYSIHPSFLLNLFLSLTLPFDIVRVRTLWLASYTVLAAIYTASIAVKLVWLCLETRTKQAALIDKTVKHGAEEVRGLFSRAFFWWITPFFFLGFKKTLSVEDLPQLDRSLSADALYHVFRKRWESASKSSRNALAWCIVSTFKNSMVYSFLSRLLMIGLNYSQPFLITRLIDYVGAENPNRNDGYGLIGAFALVFILKAVFNCLYEHHTFRFITQMRGAIVSMLYEKTLDRKFAEHSDAAAVTLMSSDVENIASGVQNVHEVWASPVEVGIALYLLERQMIWAAAVPAVISFAVVYLTGLISKAAPGRQKLWMQAVRERVAFTSSYLDTSKAIKMLGISGQVSMILQRLRVNELNLQKKFRHLMVKMNLLSGTTSNLSPAITLSLYTGVALHTGRNPLTDAQAFTSLSIISLVSSPLSNLVYSGPKATAALECFQRMQEYLLAKSRDDDRIIDQNLSDGVHSTGPEGYEQELQPMAGNQISKNIQLRCERSPVQLYQADFGWDRNSAATLLNINLSCPGSSLTMIIGTVGSGKSMLLKAILGELPCLKGFIHVQAPEIAFCDSRPWTRHGTLRDNICKPLPYDEGWYQTVIRACALDYDIESLPQRDLTIIGSNGAATSGGQRQRISIARAVYARKKLAVFDDFFSSLDASTSEHVFTRVFGKEGILRRHGVTAILATHTIAFLPFADQVVMLDGGRVLEQGPPERFHVGNSDLLDKVAASLDSIDEPGVVQDKPGTDFMSDEPEKEMERKLGDLSVYGYYLRAAGLGNVFVYFVCLLIGVFCSQFTNLWVQWWAEENRRTPFGRLSLYISIYAILAVSGAALWASCMWLVFCRIVPTSSNKLHEYLVTKVKEAPLYFLTSTDSGITLNRFSQDMSLVDRSLPADFLKTSNSFAQCIMSVVFVSIGAKYMAPLIPLSAFVIYWIQKFYLRTSRQLRHLDLETKSPLYTQFTETLSGLVTIRAFNWQKDMQEEHQKMLQTSQHPYYFLFVIQRWLILVLDLFVAGIAALLAILSVFVHGIGPVGVSLISLVTFNQQLAELINFWTLMETSIGAVTRIRSFQRVPSEGLPGEDHIPPPNWPSKGHLVLQNVCASYNPASQPVLQNVSFSVPPGAKLGVCGRTGSGKSSLILAILRMLELQSGDIQIDGVSLQTCPRETMRQRVTVVPQDAVLFRGSVFDNVAGFSAANDRDVLDALDKVELRGYVESRGGLDAQIDEVALSAGQRQLVCLARAIVMKRQIVLLDEVSSNVDDKTDELMQRVVRTEFTDCTVIAVAHRVHTLLDFDKIAVFEHGRVAEWDTPDALRGRPGSLFRRFYGRV